MCLYQSTPIKNVQIFSKTINHSNSNTIYNIYRCELFCNPSLNPQEKLTLVYIKGTIRVPVTRQKSFNTEKSVPRAILRNNQQLPPNVIPRLSLQKIGPSC